jgi:hypothetical protein
MDGTNGGARLARRGGRLRRGRRIFDAQADGLLRAPRQRNRNVTRPAQQSVVLQATLTSAVGDRDNVIRFPPRLRRAPGAAGGAIRGRRLRPGPLAVRLDDVESTEAAGPFVPLLDLLTHVRRAAANLPLVHTGVAAERAAGRAHTLPAPAANRLTGGVALRLAPLFDGDDARPEGAHGLEYRRRGGRALGGCGATEETETHEGEDAPRHPARLVRFTRAGWRRASFLRSPSFTSFLRVESS